MSKWNLINWGSPPIHRVLPDLGSHVRVYHKDWEDEFTPSGTREASYIDGEFIMGKWNVEQDCWDVVEAQPTHWTYPDKP